MRLVPRGVTPHSGIGGGIESRPARTSGMDRESAVAIINEVLDALAKVEHSLRALRALEPPAGDPIVWVDPVTETAFLDSIRALGLGEVLVREDDDVAV